jgi:HlyD family secretion protein
VVTATVDGMVIDVPVKKGQSVIESNNFNPGTTIATVANMGDMIFQGQVDESEVGKIKVGMKLAIKIGALERETFDGTLEYIAPKGKLIDGAIQFEIKASIVPQGRACSSAPATAPTPTSCSTSATRCWRSARRWSSTRTA